MLISKMHTTLENSLSFFEDQTKPLEDEYYKKSFMQRTSILIPKLTSSQTEFQDLVKQGRVQWTPTAGNPKKY